MGSGRGGGGPPRGKHREGSLRTRGQTSKSAALLHLPVGSMPGKQSPWRFPLSGVWRLTEAGKQHYTPVAFFLEEGVEGDDDRSKWLQYCTRTFM